MPKLKMSDFILLRRVIRYVAATIPDGDVEDVPGYMLSIEEWRRKAEQDEIDRLAKEAKMKLITQLEVIRNQVAVLLEENGAKERNQQLALEDFVIDFRLFKLVFYPIFVRVCCTFLRTACSVAVYE